MRNSVLWKMPFRESTRNWRNACVGRIQTIIHEIGPMLQEDDEQRHHEIKSVRQQNDIASR